MLRPDGEQLLKDFASRALPRRVTEVVAGVAYHVMGYGHSNAVSVIGETSVILIDTLDSDYRAGTLKAFIAAHTHKPVKTIIYTHGHPDRRGTAAAFGIEVGTSFDRMSCPQVTTGNPSRLNVYGVSQVRPLRYPIYVIL